VLPPDFGPLEGRAIRLEVRDRGDNDRLGVNRVLARAEPALGPGGAAYAAIPDWQARGLRDNIEPRPPVGGPERAYLKVQGSWLVRCRQ
jgi:hypothetical protein